MNVIHLVPRERTPPSPAEEFGLCRRSMFRAFQVWLTTNPSADDVALEIEATKSVLVQLRALAEAQLG